MVLNYIMYTIINVINLPAGVPAPSQAALLGGVVKPNPNHNRNTSFRVDHGINTISKSTSYIIMVTLYTCR